MSVQGYVATYLAYERIPSCIGLQIFPKPLKSLDNHICQNKSLIVVPAHLFK